MNFVSVRLQTVPTSADIDLIKRIWERLEPRHPFDCYVLREKLVGHYREEARTTADALWFAVLALVISSLGYFGMASYLPRSPRSSRRCRSPIMLIAHSAKLVVVAGLIAWPVTRVVVDSWLEGFAYHGEPSLGVLAGAGSLGLVAPIALLGYLANHRYPPKRTAFR